jgi:GT2 family glycosyltransferase
MYRLRRGIQNEPLVSLVIPTRGRPHGKRGDLLARCLRSLDSTAWRKFEVIVATDNGELSDAARDALERLTHTVVDCAPLTSFNFSHKINKAVRHAQGDHVVLFNDDLEVTSPDWLTAMLEYSQLPQVGAVGAKLVYPDGRLQHVGMLIGVCGLAAHAFHRSPGGTTGYAGNVVVARNCSAVTAACLMTRRAVFDEMGGLDEEFPVDFNDVDFCLRLRAAGYRVVYTPYAELIHHESASFGKRLQSSAELARMRQRWGAILEHDPFYNPNLSKLFTDYRLQP